MRSRHDSGKLDGLWAATLIVCAVGIAGAGRTAAAQASPDAGTLEAASLDDRHVRLAIDAIVEELYRRKQSGTLWDPAQWSYKNHGSETQEGGYTALTVLALLYAGQSYQDPRLRDAVDHLEASGMNGTYALSCRAQVWAQLPARYLPRLEADARWLMDTMNDRHRGWSYDSPPRRSWYDNSLRQYGGLGLWEAAKRGVEVHERFWRLLETSFVESQQADGGWNYKNDDDPPRGSMTAAGLTVLMITQDFLHAEAYVEVDRRGPSPADEAIERGLAWMDQNFSATEHPGRLVDFYYYLYGVERVGLASGFKTFGGHDWYREGAAELLRRLCAWDPETATMTVHERIAGDGRASKVSIRHLAFGLMFLSRGRVPVALNKLRVPDLAWNNRPRDISNLAAWIRDHSETPVNWQIVDLDDEPEQWLDAPVLYLASHEPILDVGELQRSVKSWRRARQQHRRNLVAGDLEPGETEPVPPDVPRLDKLRRYLELGGLLLAVNDGSGRRFAESIELAGEIMFPDYTWRTVEKDHWVYTSPQPVEGKRLPLKALSNGVRELIILVDRADLGRSLQTRRKIETAHFQTASNIYFYASELGRPRPRLERHAPPDAGTAETDRRVSIVRAVHEGTWNPEPMALPLLARHLAATHGIEARIADAPLVGLHEIDPPPHLVVVNGIGEARLTPNQLLSIEAYVRGGGVVLVETPGGRGEFTASLETQIGEQLDLPVRSANRSRIITARDLPGAERLARVDYRPFALHHFGSRENASRLRAIELKGRPRVLFSREDIAHGLLDQPCWGVSGYGAETARALMTNIVLHAMGP